MSGLRVFATKAVCFLVTTSTLVGVGMASEKPARSTPLRSDLWRMEFHNEQKQATEGDGLDTESADAAESARVESDRDSAMLAAELKSPAEGVQSTIALPGEPQIDFMSAETPLAHWRVDDAARPTAKTPATLSDWQLSQARGFQRTRTAPTLTGPSAITFAVAIVAGIVVTGALFSGRDV